ncbi:MAG: hypothetical protein GY865_14705 [candidate division Zixibacteria bacterium]|nr:hypothetical protein [candidate division Zixibacteria bacterium]
MFKHLQPSYETWLRRQGYEPKQFPITLPWQPVRAGADQVVARDNGRRCVAFVLEHFQGDGGPFENINLRLRNIGVWDSRDKDGHINTGFANIINEIQEEFDLHLKEKVLTLRSLQDTEIKIPGGTRGKDGVSLGDGISLDFASFIEDFIDTCSHSMFERLQRLLRHPQLTELKIYLLPTGRGAFFPLVGSMLWAHQERLRSENKPDKQKLEQVRIDPDFAKTVVSQGICYLAVLPKMAQNIMFVPRNLPSLGIQGDLDSETGLPLFIPLCAGLPAPADGWQVASYPLRPGNRQVSVTLYLSTDNQKVLADNDKRLGEVSEYLNITSETAPLAHIMVKATKEDCLDIYLGFPSEADVSSKNYDNWERNLLGHYEIMAGACAKA